ncbi:MAG: hypothetical protein IPN71_02660 [Fibrobacteres bacterium]|nr:hypothetical protein [Fibrobacterota bacterium]
MTLRKLFIALGLFAAATTQAARTTLSDLGLSVFVPEGWSLSFLTASQSDTESTRMYSMINIANSDRASFTFKASNNVALLGAHSWTTLEGFSQSLFIQGLPLSELFIDDSVKQDGLFAWRVYGRYGDFDTADLPTGFTDEYSRFFAYGDIGWTIAFEGDTADIDTAGPTYTKILDSVKVDRSFQALPLKVRDGSRQGAYSRVRVMGASLAIEGQSLPIVRASDLLGRGIQGDLVQTADGWLWTPRSLHHGVVQLRILGPGRDESLRAVLRP